MKNRFLCLTFIVLMLFSLTACTQLQSQSDTNSELPYILSKKNHDSIYNVSIGDAFEFKNNRIPGFGFVLIEITEFSNHEIQYSVTPIKLDTSKREIDRFINGEINIGSIDDRTEPSGKIFGLYSFGFLSKKEFKNVFVEMNKAGHLHMSNKYLNIQSGTVATDIVMIKSYLDYWNTRFDAMHKEKVTKVIEQ